MNIPDGNTPFIPIWIEFLVNNITPFIRPYLNVAVLRI